MQNSRFCFGLLFAFLLSPLSAITDTINADLINKKVKKTVDLSTHLPKIVTSITLENAGKTAVKSFLFSADPSLADNLSFLGASVKGSEEETTKLEVTKTSVSSHAGVAFYRIALPQSLGAGQEITVDVESAFAHVLKPYPHSITQAEKQFVKFAGNRLFYSPYKTVSLTTEVKCSSGSIETYTKTKASVSDNVITYGPFEDVQKFSDEEMLVHYENNGPFLTVTNMQRLIEVSHWGNIAVEESVDIEHTGAQLKGPFSRYDYQRSQDGLSAVKSFKTILPSSARDVYYRDEIGNISTSNLRDLDDSMELELKPRFPLFGGWKTHYVMGYNVPSYQYLYNSGDQYVLKMRFIDHIYDDQVVDSAHVRIMLPEGASDVTLKLPYEINRSPDELFFTYLDTTGRPVIMLQKDNLVEMHIQDFELHYRFPHMFLLREPLLVVGFIYMFFLLIIVYVRMDFSITKDEASESRMRVASLIEQVQAIQDRRTALYQSYEDAVNKYKSSKDSGLFSSNRKRIDADHKSLTAQISTLQAKLKAEAATEAVDKVSELQRLDAQVRDQINLASNAAERLVAGKIQKGAYVDYEAGVKGKRDDIIMRLEAHVSSL
ncbi:hypothetical protein CAPTEDRAFT_159283 [Capitella teleta]|uniref:Dolichyl-diphosphooligosaccharide--protein glycosyltransferase subunit 1 n=1 Tax=Capitella teleta TaxID=283909 RepID=R7TCG8_CAPTE|nr:hypothetical protein CAPTEDRAFT_159283 [Capitella teleta]|eukprot:ELT91404.1 hypothetical protein CAPTEDRAFT_159283 [Capitella teleta]